MNRIESATEILSLPSITSPSLKPAIPPSLASRTVERIRRHGADSVTPHATFAPIHYEPGYAYPLLIWLHGPEGDEGQIRDVMPEISLRNFVAVAPRGSYAARSSHGAFSWRQSDEAIDEAEARVLDCVDIACRRFNIHTDRVFLAGAGCGGTMALRTAWNHPGRFAGVASIGGPLPADGRPMRNINALRRLPCFLASGRTSVDYPEADVCRDLRMLHAAGCTVALRQYPCGDDLTTVMLADLNRWIMDIVCPQSA
jgi:phospholipase/carboxylesterase